VYCNAASALSVEANGPMGFQPQARVSERISSLNAEEMMDVISLCDAICSLKEHSASRDIERSYHEDLII